MDKYINRQQAGRILAHLLRNYAQNLNVIVLALPRGGVPVAYEIANELSVPLDVFIVRKLGVPWHEELAMGAIASGGTVVLNDELVQSLNLQQSAIDQVIKSEQIELLRREKAYRGTQPFPDLSGKIIILVDDGIATGATMQAAIQALRKHHPASIIVAVPVAADATCEALTQHVDLLICPLRPVNFYAVGLWYEDFSQTTDEEVVKLLRRKGDGNGKP